GGHVAELSLELPGARRLRGSTDRLRDAEIDELYHAVCPDQDVVRRDVAVDDPAQLPVRIATLVSGMEPRGHVGDDPHRHLGWNRSALAGLGDHGMEALPLDPLHRHPHDPALVADVVHLDDVRMTDAAHEAHLVHEHLDELGVFGELEQHRLDRHEAVVLAVRRPPSCHPDGRHAAAADAQHELVIAEPRALPKVLRHARFAGLPTNSPAVRCFAPRRRAARARSARARAVRARRRKSCGRSERDMKTLSEQFQDQDRRKALVDDALTVLDREVQEKSGLTGMAIKGGYKLVQGVRPGFVRQVIEALLDDFLAALNPVYAEAAEKK